MKDGLMRGEKCPQVGSIIYKRMQKQGLGGGGGVGEESTVLFPPVQGMASNNSMVSIAH